MPHAATYPQAPAVRQEITVAGMTWNVLDLGQGERTLVLLPGTLGSVDIFRHQVNAFSARARVIVLGYPGTSNLDQLAESFWQLLAQLEVDSPCLAGSSLGAYLLQHFTARSAYRVHALVLGNTFVDSHRLRFLPMFDPQVIDQAGPADIKQMWLGFAERLQSPALRQTLLPMVRDSQSALELYGRSLAIAHLGPVARSAVPAERITLVSCADDPVCSAEVAAEVAAAYGASRHVRLNAGGHYPHVLNPAEYDAVLSAALD